MGRRCCCDTSCLLINSGDILTATEYAEVFTIQGNYTVDTETEDINNAGVEALTFNGSATLTLSRPDLIFGEDNFAIHFGITTQRAIIDNLSEGDQTTETLTFTLGVNAITVNISRTESGSPGESSAYSFIIKYNNTLLYTGTSEYDPIFGSYSSSISILFLEHYLIRKDGNIHYYIGNHLAGICPDANIATPINFSYSFTATNPNTTLTLEPQFLRVWKPDKWWKLSRYQQLPKIMPTNPSSSEANDLYNIIAYDEVEDEGCVSPGTPYGIPDPLSNIDVRFSELSPQIAIQFSGIKSSKSYLAAIPTRAERIVRVDDGGGNYHYESVDELNTIYDKIRAEETRRENYGTTSDYDDDNTTDESSYDTINGLKTDILDLDGIMTTLAGVWDTAGYEYYLEWYNGYIVRIKYDGVTNQVLNGVLGGDKVTFQNMMPVTVMKNTTWYSPDYEDSAPLWGTPANVYHGGFVERLRWCYYDVGDGYSNVPIGVNRLPTRHVGGSKNNARWDPFPEYSSDAYGSSATDTFAIDNTTLEFRKGIIAPDIDINLSPHGVGIIDFIFNKPDTTDYSTEKWRNSFIANISNDNVLHYGASYGTTTTLWYETGSNSSQMLSERDTTSQAGGYFKIQYTTAGNISATTDRLIYVIEDQFGAKSKGVITIHFTGDTLGEHKEKTVIPLTDNDDYPPSAYEENDCSDYDTVCEVRCTVPHGLHYNVVHHAGDTPIPIEEGPCTILLHYVHDGKTCQLSDLINVTTPKAATLKIPSPWTSIDGVLQDTIQATFVAPNYYGCSLAHDFNYGLSNAILQSGEPDNVDFIRVEYSDSTTEDVYPYPEVGCQTGGYTLFKSIGETGYSGSILNTPGNPCICNSDNPLPYCLPMTSQLYRQNSYTPLTISKIKVFYVSGAEVELDASLMSLDDFPYLALPDYYNTPSS